MAGNELRIAGTVDDSIVDGDGIRYTIFVQGCPRRCPGCHNPETQCFEGGRVAAVEELLAEIEANPLLTGVTFSGGEPFMQPAPLVEIARACHKRGLSIWSYTGFTLQELHARHDTAVEALLSEVDVLVDGDYREAERDLTLMFRGSRNQRVIDMKASRKQKRLVLLYQEETSEQSA